jgi:hypothetical protein
MFLKLAVWLYCKVERPSDTIRPHMKQSIEAAKAWGIDASMAPTLPINQK